MSTIEKRRTSKSEDMEVSNTEESRVSNTEQSKELNDAGLPPDVAALFEEFSGPKYDKLMRKMDLHLIPIVSPSCCVPILQDTNTLPKDCCAVPPGVSGQASYREPG